MTPAERMRRYRQRQHILQGDAVGEPEQADDVTLARLILRSAVGIKRSRNDDQLKMHRHFVVKYCRILCNRYE
ncbi:MAG: hypothetical protein K6346_05440 [Halothiobacillaceae bacterium]